VIVLASWLREAADEVDKAHRVLDELGAPREIEHGFELTLAARIATLTVLGPPEPDAGITPRGNDAIGI
jgi:hypothetical protein